ncbi:MAG: endonuclease/exonuclease/phosphatase family protein [Gammaproteobacteria bacterium]|nr:endonuclease/exonuclease/phosphatase family protein [Gammaproteobacteria bacterium]NNJ79935.1 endonuclease [Xanthomonadales bacterium]
MKQVARLCTYNVHACVGRDGRYRPERIAEVLAGIDADIVALQEVEIRGDDGSDLLESLAQHTGLAPVAGPVLLRGQYRFGNALLARFPVKKVIRHDLSWSNREPRDVIDAFFECDNGILRVMATHLGLRPIERREQVLKLLAHLEARHADAVVLMGDLNEWLLWGRPLRWLRRHFTATPDIRTFPARKPLFPLDQIWVEPGRALLSMEAARSPAIVEASDHLPLVAEVACNPDSVTQPQPIWSR